MIKCLFWFLNSSISPPLDILFVSLWDRKLLLIFIVILFYCFAEHTSVLEVWRVSHKQHVHVWQVCNTDKAGLVLQGGGHAHTGSVGVRGAVIVCATHPLPCHHLAHWHTGILSPRDHKGVTKIRTQTARGIRTVFISSYPPYCLLSLCCLSLFKTDIV